MSRVRSASPARNHRHRFSAFPEDGKTQEFGVLQPNPIALESAVAAQGVADLNQLLADSITLRDLYKKHHWQAAGPVFYMIHLLYDKHFEEQNKLVDLIAERIQTLGGLALAMAPDIAEATQIPRAPKGREAVSNQIIRLVHAHEIILKESRQMAKRAGVRGDDGTNDLIVSNVVRTNEMQAWFIDQHLQ